MRSNTEFSTRVESTKVSTRLLIVGILFASGLAAAQVPSQTPLGKLSEAAGTYLGTLDLLQVFQRSECGYALTKSFPSIQSALDSEVLPTFPQYARSELTRTIDGLRTPIHSQSEDMVRKIIDGAKQRQDAKTACGLAAGLAMSISGNAYESWLTAKRQYAGR
ncbi:hypothetical protein LJR296_007783 [Cupriavidus necator]|uniref:hypothetical protein n=1 Tax=Cupriavidus necator TaxID=106590 RepID=UPI003ECFC80E